MGRIREEKKKSSKNLNGKKKNQEKEDAGARKGRKATMHSVFPMMWLWMVER